MNGMLALCGPAVAADAPYLAPMRAALQQRSGALRQHGGALHRCSGAPRACSPNGAWCWHAPGIVLAHAAPSQGIMQVERHVPSLDGRYFVSADVRIDDRATLTGKLGLCAEREPLDDAVLLLHAYRRWGSDCVMHLLGDFAFAIWDARDRRLFCARDPFGVKPLFWTTVRDTLLIANTLRAVRAHPGVPSALDDQAVADFLVQGLVTDDSRTTFAGIQRLRAGHRLIADAGRAPVIERYFALPENAPVLRYRDPDEYVAHFGALLRDAVADRVQSDRVSISLSGGVDSTLLAAVARDCMAPTSRLSAYTHVFEHLIAHDEPHFAALAARHLDLPLRHVPADEFFTRRHWLERAAAPEPALQYAAAHLTGCCRSIADDARVVLTGYDGDALLTFSLADRWRRQVRGLELTQLTNDLLWHAAERRLPRIGLRTWLRRRWNAQPATSEVPDWLQPGVAARWRSNSVDLPAAANADERAPARMLLTSAALRQTLDELDPGATGLNVEFRHPMLDLRIVRFCLALPPVPWCVDKRLFRAAAAHVLPPAIVQRAKSPLSDDPRAAGLADPAFWPAHWKPSETFARYVDPARFVAAMRSVAHDAAQRAAYATSLTAAVTFDTWLRTQELHETIAPRSAPMQEES